MKMILDLYQTVAVAVVVFFVGSYLKKKISFFQRFCIPAPVIGGILFALLTLALNQTGTVTIQMDNTMQQVFMTLFFSSVGYTASLRLLKKGGVQVLLLAGISTVLILAQDVLGVALAKAFGLNPLLGLCVGSVPMVGGHGTAGSFGPLLEEMGVTGASTVAISAATFGLVMGSLIGGPIAQWRIRQRNLTPSAVQSGVENDAFTSEAPSQMPSGDSVFTAFCMLFLAAGIGSVISSLLQKTGMTFPSYIGAMLAAALLRNFSDATRTFSVMEDIISILGNVCLSLFLAMSLMSLRLWELADLAGPMIVMLMAQTVLMALIAAFGVFYLFGRDYEAAVIASATCGFGMGAVPNAIANMQTVTGRYGPAPRAFFIVPLVGSLFIDFINSGIITMFVNILL